MSDFPRSGPIPPIISTYTQNISPAAVLRNLATSIGPSSIAWVANVAVFAPMWIPWPYPVSRVFWGNGSTAGGNVNFGIFRPSGVRVYSTGSTAQVGTSNIQFVTPTPFVLTPGTYYFAVVADGTTNRLQGFAATALQSQQCGVFQQASNFALADPATFATPASTVYGLCGVTRTGASAPF